MTSTSFSDILIGLSARHPDRIAVESSTVRLSYAELVALASRSARAMADKGVARGMRVAISCRRNEDVLVLMVALWMLGATAVPIDFRTRSPERKALVEDFELGFLLEDRAGEEAGCPALVIDGGWREEVNALPATPLFSQGGDVAALVALTSGSSGRRLGALISHAELVMRVCLPVGLSQRDAGGRLLNLSPLSFTASVHNTFAHLWNGGTVVFFPALFGAHEVVEAISTRNITSVATVPAVVRSLMEVLPAREAPAFPKLNYFYCASAPLSAQDKLRARSILSGNFVEVYAATLCGRLTLLESGELDTHADSVGRVLPQVALQVVDSRKQPLPAGEIGAIRVRTPGMSLSLCGPGASRERGDRVADGWVYTGDIGVLDAHGFLRLLGRDSEMIVRGGENVYPAEIESVSLELEGVREAVVVGRPSERVGEEIALFVVAQPQVTEARIAGHLRARLVPSKLPRTIRFVGELPRNSNGKVDYARLRKELQS